jgi:putative component of membrane protein insertase Oxa1/YidC/SpoIIIJ protein YidD
MENAPLKRPNISTAKKLLSFVLWIFAIGIFVFLCFHIGSVFYIPAYVSVIVAVLGGLLIVAAKAKAFVRSCILLYQKHAPEKMRRSCLFVPSCSEYMLLAIDKYGVFVGVCKGLVRLSRCHHPNGGEDYP